MKIDDKTGSSIVGIGRVEFGSVVLYDREYYILIQAHYIDRVSLVNLKSGIIIEISISTKVEVCPDAELFISR